MTRRNYLHSLLLLLSSLGLAFSIANPCYSQEKPARTLKSEKDAISSIAFSPDGNYLASGSFDTTIVLWDVRTGEAKETLEGLNERVSSVAFSPDSKFLAGGSWMLHESGPDQAKTGAPYTGEVKIWDVESGQVKQTLQWHSAPMWAIAYSPNGELLAGGTGLVKKEDGRYYGQVIIWDTQSGEIEATLTGHHEPIWCVAFSPDGLRLAAGTGLDFQSKTAEVIIWNLATGQIELTLKGQPGRVISVAFSPNGDVLANAASDRSIRLWDAKTGELKQALIRQGETETQPRPVGAPLYSDQVRRNSPGFFSVVRKGWTNSVAFSKDGKYLAGIGATSVIRIWEVATGKIAQTISTSTHGFYSIAFSPDGKLLATGNADGSVDLWDIHLSP